MPVPPSPQPPSADDPRFALLDLERLADLLDLGPGSTAYLDRAIGNFCVNSVVLVEQVREAVQAADSQTVRQLSHRLAGGALNLGAHQAGEAARAVEALADTGSLEGVETLLEPLVAHLARAREALEAYRTTYES